MTKQITSSDIHELITSIDDLLGCADVTTSEIAGALSDALLALEDAADTIDAQQAEIARLLQGYQPEPPKRELYAGEEAK